MTDAELRRVVHFDVPWLPVLTALTAAGLYASLPDQFVFGPHHTVAAVARWLVLGLVVILLATLVSLHRPELEISDEMRSMLRRRSALTLMAIISAANILSVVLLVRFIINGGKASGHQLVLAAIEIWWTNVIVFGLWFWELDRGGPTARLLDPGERDFLFPQMTLDPRLLTRPFEPTFIDYFYVAFTNATAFSPTDTLPLTTQAKLLMLVESGVSLLTLLMVASRAVNIL